MDEPVIDWVRVDTVLLDMDGTVLDLHFDNMFWQHYLPEQYALRHGLALEQSRQRLAPIFERNAGRLNWYCTDFWARTTGLDLIALKRDLAHLIQPLPGALGFLDRVRGSGRPLWLVTNAHPDSVALKLERTGIGAYFEQVITSHEFGHAKEEPGFWSAMAERYAFDPARSLFVDDSPAVVAAAAAYGIGQVVALSLPASQGIVREHGHQPNVADLAALNTI